MVERQKPLKYKNNGPPSKKSHRLKCYGFDSRPYIYHIHKVSSMFQKISNNLHLKTQVQRYINITTKKMILFVNNEPVIHACVTIALFLYYNSLRSRHSLHRKAVLPPSRSPWVLIYRSADDSSFLHLTGMSRQAFEKLKDILLEEEEEEEEEAAGPGRPRSLDSAALLGLYLLCWVDSEVEVDVSPVWCSRKHGE